MPCAILLWVVHSDDFETYDSTSFGVGVYVGSASLGCGDGELELDTGLGGTVPEAVDTTT